MSSGNYGSRIEIYLDIYRILIVQLHYVLFLIIPCIHFAIIMDYWALMFPTLFVLVGPFVSVSWRERVLTRFNKIAIQGTPQMAVD